MNGQQIFPHPSTSLYGIQHRETDGKVSGPIPLGYVFESLREVSPEGEDIGLFNIRFTVIDLDFHPVPLNSVVLSVIREPTGDLSIVSVGIEGTAEEDTLSWRQCRGKPTCLKNLLFDRIRSLVASTKTRVSEMSSRVKTPPPSDAHRPSHHRCSHPPHAGAGPQHRPHYRHRPSWQHMFVKIVRFAVIPAALGVLAGLTASAVGMVVGHFIVVLWQRYRGSAPTEISASRMEQAPQSEKQPLMDEESPDAENVEENEK